MTSALSRSTGHTEEINSRDVIYGLLKSRILRFDLLPGEKLSENGLAESLEVSRTILRDGISRLCEEGYVSVLSRSGTFVSLIDMDRVRQAVDAHITLEQEILRELGERRLGAEERRSLERFLRRIDRLRERQARGEEREENILLYMREKDSLHRLLSEICRREAVWDFFRTLDSDLLRVRYLLYSTFDYGMRAVEMSAWEQSEAEYRMLLDNILRKDTKAAILVLQTHYQSVLWKADSLRAYYPRYFSD